MRPNFLSLFSLLFLVSSVPKLVASQDFTEPAAYNNYIIEEQNKVVGISLLYIANSVHGTDLAAIEASRQDVIKQVDASLKRVEKLEAFRGDQKLRNESVAVFKLYQEAYANDFNEAMRLKKDKENSYEAMERYFKAQEKAERKLSQASERFEKAQRQFAEKHAMVLQEDEAASGLLTRIAAVNNYSRRVFLAYFKVAKADAAFMEGVEQRKTSQLEKQRQQLENVTGQVLSELDTVQPFRGDAAFRDATRKLVQFYHDLAEKDYPTLVEVMRKKPDEMTASDAENYNSIVQRYNATNVELVTAFNRENVALLQQHIPSQ